ncbi:MAG: glycosyltransferase family 2 protein [Candidatus Thermoplasmatota archaeon]
MVVPALNEELLIGTTITTIPECVDCIFVIDDGSTDSTSLVVQRVQDSRICLLRHESNKGVGASIAAGYSAALARNIDIVAVMAGDNQMDPDHLADLLDPLIDDRADYSKGNRLSDKESRHEMPGWRCFGNFILTLMTKAASGLWHISDSQNGYTAISRSALASIDLERIYPYYGYCNDVLIKLGANGMRVVDVAIPARYGSEVSKIRYFRFAARVGPLIVRGGVSRWTRRHMSWFLD